MISIESSGNTKRTEAFLHAMMRGNMFRNLQRLGATGVAALSRATPVESGETAASWNYEVKVNGASCTITWTNSNSAGGIPVAILLQYGHGTGTGGYVKGRDYINPAIKPVFDQIAQDVWREVTKA